MNAQDNVLFRVEGLVKSFASAEILKGIDLELRRGEVLALIGPSGSGKSTLLRCLNLLEEPTGGQIYFEGQSILDPKFKRRQYHSQVGMVFQQYNLFPNLTVLENCCLAQQKVLGRSRQEAEQKSLQLLEQVGMAAYSTARPEQLSGGQRQRVAIARSLAMDPKALFLDEPTSALDPGMVQEVLAVMRQVAESGMTMVVVSHEMSFARDVASRVCFMQDGVIEESGPAAEIFAAPRSPKLRQFLAHVPQ